MPVDHPVHVQANALKSWWSERAQSVGRGWVECVNTSLELPSDVEIWSYDRALTTLCFSPDGFKLALVVNVASFVFVIC